MMRDRRGRACHLTCHIAETTTKTNAAAKAYATAATDLMGTTPTRNRRRTNA